jgi:hypothetical protein
VSFYRPSIGHLLPSCSSAKLRDGDRLFC